jgi:hypothetical protein
MNDLAPVSIILPQNTPDAVVPRVHIVIEATQARQQLLAAVDASVAQLSAALETIANDAVQKAFFTHQAQRRAMLADLT